MLKMAEERKEGTDWKCTQTQGRSDFLTQAVIRSYRDAEKEFELCSFADLLCSRAHSNHVHLWHNQVLSPSCQSQCTPELFIKLYFIYVCISPMPLKKVGGSRAL